VIRDHNLLQTLTRVNRPYKKYEYGYVVNFADISQAFDRTNRMYFDELQNELGDDVQFYTHLFKSEEEIRQELQEINETLFHYNTTNREIFSQLIAHHRQSRIAAFDKSVVNCQRVEEYHSP
jgi:type I restriction enzyme, R subunit